jgi:hypothetical protein
MMRGMRCFVSLTLAAVLVLSAGSVVAQNAEAMPSGLDLVKRCHALTGPPDEQSDDEPDAETVEDYGYCLGYLAGFVSGFAARTVGGDESMFCPPENASFRDFVDAIQRWLIQHPEGLHKLGAYVAAAAFKQSFPCSLR